MSVLRSLVLALFVAGCATTSDRERLAERCQENIEHDERCIEVLTSDDEGYESRAQVMAEEERRDAKAFEDRLARLRREEEERQAKRARTSTISSAVDEEEEDDEELPEEALDLAEAKLEGPGRLEVGSSVRALEVPTPEAYLRGARCILQDELSALRKRFEEGKRKQAQVGDLAVVILDAEALLARIEDEMKHRRLPSRDGECKEHQDVIELLRSLVGPRVDDRALVRLTKELEVRGGLPRAER